MKLEFLWFDQYKQLTDFQANLGSPYVYEFNKKNALRVRPDVKYLESYFKDSHHEYAVDASAIVGENGVGKSTVLDFLRDAMLSRLEATEYLLVFRKGTVRKVLTSIPRKKLNIDVNEEISPNVQFVVSNRNLKVPTILLFSNVFDARFVGEHNKDYEKNGSFFNMTTNYLLAKSNDNISFLNSEFEKQIYFIYDYLDNLKLISAINIPENIKINLIREDVDAPLSEYHFLLNLDHPEIYFDINSRLSGFKSEMLQSVLIRYLDDLHNILMQKGIHVPIEYIYTEYSIEEGWKLVDILDLGEYDKENILDQLEVKVYYHIVVGERFSVKRTEALIKELKTAIGSRKDEYKSFIKKIVKIKICEKRTEKEHEHYLKREEEEVEKFVKAHKTLFKNEPIINFTWTELSSGEYGVLSLFGRINAVLKSEEYDSQRSFLLLIDEGDLYFHPQWQKDWLYYFLQFIGEIFKSDVQILLTTHSPFVLSDFPKSNVLFLGKDPEGTNQMKGSTRTLGANILELFSNSFFLKGGLVGKYGKSQINKLTRKLIESSPEMVTYNKESYKKLIDNIGEPLVRNRLLNLYSEKMKLDTHDEISRRIEQLENEIERLKLKGRYDDEND